MIVKGKIEVKGGESKIFLNDELKNICDISTLIITATPLGESNGVFIKEITKDYIILKENNAGTHNFFVNYIISGTIKNSESFNEEEILNVKFESNMEGVMHNDYDTTSLGNPIWFDGKNVRHDKVDDNIIGRSKKMEELQKELNKQNRLQKDNTNTK